MAGAVAPMPRKASTYNLETLTSAGTFYLKAGQNRINARAAADMNLSILNGNTAHGFKAARSQTKGKILFRGLVVGDYVVSSPRMRGMKFSIMRKPMMRPLRSP